MSNEGMGRRHRPRLRPLVLSVALALSIGIAPAFAGTASGIADNDRDRLQHSVADQRSLAERIQPGHPWYTRYLEVTTRQQPQRPAGAQAVTNCNDSGAGSLRAAVNNAVSGDTIDLSALTCGLITLSSGALATAVDDLTIIGPGDNNLLVSGDSSNPVLVHLGEGTLTVEDLRVGLGSKYVANGVARGGCLYSQGGIEFTSSTAKYCEVGSGSGGAQGGAIFATNGALIQGSRIFGSEVVGGSGGAVFVAAGSLGVKYSQIDDNVASNSGGGVLVTGPGTFKYSTIEGNEAGRYGGGVATRGEGDVIVRNTTIAGNTAGSGGGGIDLFGSAGAALISNSTIANNTAVNTGEGVRGGGLWIARPVQIVSSTISGNVERHNQANKYGGGVHISQSVASVELTNTIVSDNWKYTMDGTEPLASDIHGADEDTPFVLSGSGNLLGNLIDATAPAGTRIGRALLGPLQDNGGLTDTMMPLRRSPAINGGGATSLTVDQRGTGFARSIGAAVDAGAVETDTLFSDLFERNYEVSP